LKTMSASAVWVKSSLTVSEEWLFVRYPDATPERTRSRPPIRSPSVIFPEAPIPISWYMVMSVLNDDRSRVWPIKSLFPLRPSLRRSPGNNIFASARVVTSRRLNLRLSFTLKARPKSLIPACGSSELLSPRLPRKFSSHGPSLRKAKVESEMTPSAKRSEKLRKLLSTLTEISDIPGNPR